MTVRHTSANITNSLNEVLESWEIEHNQIVACVTDNGANVKKAVCDLFGQANHISCFADTLNLLVEDAINGTGNFKEVLEKVRTIVQEILEDSLKVLKPFYLITEEMSVEKVITLSKAIPIRNILTNKLKDIILDTQKFYVESLTSYPHAIVEIEKLLLSTSPPMIKSIADDSQDEDDVWTPHDRLACTQHQADPESQSINLSTKLKLYLDANLTNRKVNPLQIWSKIKSTFWKISQIAPMYLCIPATPVPSERLFSKAGSTLNEKRNRLKPETFNEILFLNSLTRRELRTILNKE
ncbi:uncharacterized protein LOC141857342 [Brevipalpus obovatus]|uniref:uncharacterized protein LOC141857342 n=1 Tax=Brevipalpus obovatus TaxID=246614 RepID=UPI003D9F8C66